MTDTAVGEERGRPDLRPLEAMETVESVMPVQQPFKLASREVRAEPSEVRINVATDLNRGRGGQECLRRVFLQDEMPEKTAQAALAARGA